MANEIPMGLLPAHLLDLGELTKRVADDKTARRGQVIPQQARQQGLGHVAAADKADLPSSQHGAIIRRPFKPAQLATAGRGCYRVIDRTAIIVF